MKIQDLKNQISQFIRRYVDLEKPLLVGVSGGGDSLALLCLLREYASLKLAMAHVDHGYRQESAEEAVQLKKLSDEMGVEFHGLRLDPLSMEGNLEDGWRVERYAFFKRLCDCYGYQAVVLGHHADDQVETVLKRVLEGAHLTTLSGILSEQVVHGVRVLRPLMGVEKAVLMQYVTELGRVPFQDASNGDARFLRARMRLEMLPLLDRLFGKNVRGPLRRLGEESAALKEYLDLQTAAALASVVAGPMGSLLDLSQAVLPHRFELHHLIRRFCGENQKVLGREQIENVCALIEKGVANRWIQNGQMRLYVDRRRLFLMPREPLLCGWSVEEVSVQQKEAVSLRRQSSWLDAWKGSLAVVLPEGKYTLAMATATEAYPRTSSIGKWWTDHQVPAFLRTLVPVICCEGKIVHEFLTGERGRRSELESVQGCVRIHLICK